MHRAMMAESLLAMGPGPTTVAMRKKEKRRLHRAMMAESLPAKRLNCSMGTAPCAKAATPLEHQPHNPRKAEGPYALPLNPTGKD